VQFKGFLQGHFGQTKERHAVFKPRIMP
jgi:hypothetical protein